MPHELLIHGGRVLDPARDFDATADVRIVDGRVAEISQQRLTPGPGATPIDAEGCLVTPGLLDIHVHFREPGVGHEETIARGSAAAVAGGFTTVCCMPNTTPPLDTPEQVQFVAERGRAANRARVFAVAAATRGRAGETPADLAALADAGAVGFSDDGDCIASAGVMRDVLRAAAAVDRCVMQHAQDPTLTPGSAMNAGPLADELGLIGWPREAEEIIVDRDVRLNASIGCRYHVQHLSSGGSVEIIRAARQRGLVITGEASPHHLLLDEEVCRSLDPVTKMNPPLRTAADIRQLKEGIADGTISVLATDHAPHPVATKARPFAEASFGIVGLECALPLYRRALVDDGVIGWPQMIAMMTIWPAELVGLAAAGHGRLVEGGLGDVTVIDPDTEWTIDPEAFETTGRNCPFAGWTVRGAVVATVVAGQVRHMAAGTARASLPSP